MNELDNQTVKTIILENLTYRNYSKSTIERMLDILKRFNDYLKKRKVRDYREVRLNDLYGFKDYIETNTKRGIKKETALSYIFTVKRIFELLEEEEKIIESPFHDLEMRGKRRTVRDRVLSEKEMRDFLNSIPLGDPLDFRNRTILELFYGTGIRARELVNLEITDVYLEEKMIFVKNGKGKKDRILPVGDVVLEYLTRYIKSIRPKFVRRWLKNDSKALFLNINGVKLNYNGVENMLLKLRKKLKIEKQVSPHVIRHSFATHLINSGADIREVQLLLGHTSIDSTQIYLNFSTSQLKEVYRKFHPLENELYFDAISRESHIFEWKKKPLI